MDISEKKLELLKQSTISVVRYLDNISVAIIGTSNDHIPKEISSGTCIKIADNYFIITAAHNIKNYTKDKIFLIHSKTPKPNDINIENIGYRGGNESDNLDIGWIKISEESVESIEKEFIGLNKIQIDKNHINDDLTFVSGYPGKLVNNFIEKKILSVVPIGYQTYTLDPDSINESKKEYDIYFDYPKDGNIIFDDRANEIPEPNGISGGGFWSLNINSEGVWSTNKIKLFGIDVSWHSHRRWIKGIQIKHWLKMIIEDFPNLKTEIYKVHPKINT